MLSTKISLETTVCNNT